MTVQILRLHPHLFLLTILTIIGSIFSAGEAHAKPLCQSKDKFDVNSDGRVDQRDFKLLRRWLEQLQSLRLPNASDDRSSCPRVLKSKKPINGNVNGDRLINSRDLTALSKRLRKRQPTIIEPPIEDPTPTPNPTPTPTITPTATPIPYDVVLRNDETGSKYYGPAANDLERCDLLREAMSEAKPHDVVFLGEGTFDCDGTNKGTLLFQEELTVLGQGMDKTRLYSELQSDYQGIGFELRGGLYQDLSFEVKSVDPTEDARTVGLWEGLLKTPDGKNYVKDENGNNVAIDSTPGPWVITMERVRMSGGDWVWYHWNNQPHHFIFKSCQFFTGRQGISFMTNNLGTFTAEIRDSLFDVDTSRSGSIGWTSNRTYGGGYGVVVRGGAGTIVSGNTFRLNCGSTKHRASYVPRCAALFDGDNFGSRSGAATIVFTKNRIQLNATSSSPDAFDVFMTNSATIANFTEWGNVGSGTTGNITKNF